MKKTLDYYLKLNYPIEIYKIPEEEGGGYSATIPALGRYAFVADGETIEETIKNVLNLKDHYIKELYKKGIPIPEPELTKELNEVSGKFVVRIPKELHKSLIQRAEENGISLNQYVLYLLTKAFEQDKMDNALQNFIQKFENVFHDLTETEYNLNFNFENTKKLMENIRMEKIRSLTYQEAG